MIKTIYKETLREIKDATQHLDTTMSNVLYDICLLYTSPSPRDRTRSRMPSSA